MHCINLDHDTACFVLIFLDCWLYIRANTVSMEPATEGDAAEEQL